MTLVDMQEAVTSNLNRLSSSSFQNQLLRDTNRDSHRCKPWVLLESGDLATHPFVFF